MDKDLQNKLERMHEDVARCMSQVAMNFVVLGALLKRSGVTGKEYKDFMKMAQREGMKMQKGLLGTLESRNAARDLKG